MDITRNLKQALSTGKVIFGPGSVDLFYIPDEA